MKKKTIILLTTIILVSALLGSSILTRGHAWGDDFAAYIMQAKSILGWNMETFIDSNTFTITKSSYQIGPVAYPWGFPLMLTPVYALTGLSPIALKLPGLIAYLAFLLIFFLFINRHFSLTESLLAVSLFAFNPKLLHFLDNILSDIPFLFLSTLNLLLLDLYTHEKNKKQRLILAVLTGAVIFANFFVRTQGLILLATILCFQFARFLRGEQRKSIMAETILTIATFSAFWGILSLIFPGGQSSYLALYSGFSIDLFKDNIIYYFENFRQFFVTLPQASLFFWFFVIFCFIGLVARFREELFFVLYLVLYLVVLWSWPERQGYRFIFPALPLFIYFSLQGIEIFFNQIPKKSIVPARIFVYVILTTISITFLFNASKDAYNNLQNNRGINGPFDPFSMETYNFIKNETPPDAVIVFFKPRAMRLMTDRDALALTECNRMNEGDYLALNKKVGENLQIPPERISECNLDLANIFENRKFVVYQILK